MESRRLSVSFYITVGLIAGAIIALQIGVMRIFSIGTWSHFGSFVISIAMLGFGVMSAVMCIGTGTFQKYWKGLITASLVLFGPLMLVANAVAQQLGFNPIELIANPEQKFKLFYLFLVYFVPFLAGALFLGLVFMRGQHVFGKVYFADLAGSGLCGLVFLLSLYVVRPDWILLVPFGLWAVGTAIWFISDRAWIPLAIAALLGAGSIYVADTHTRIEVNQFKGVSYARKFPDAKRIWVDYGPFGFLEAYTSSYLHFAPGLSDNAAVNLEAMPKNAYIAMYIDSDGPIGVMKKIPKRLTAYFEFLPMYMPYVLKKDPNVFIVQLGGGISTDVALAAGAKTVTVAESNPLIRRALTEAPPIVSQTGNPLKDKRVTLVPFEGRLFVGGEKNRYDVIDLSLADSTGLSHAGGFSIVEKYNYTVETLRDYMGALKPDGILAVTLWNKEDLPKSIPKFFSTAVAAAWAQHDGKVRDKFFILHTYLSTMTLLYKKNGFTADEVKKLRGWSDDMSYEVLYYPGETFDAKAGPAIFRGYRASHFDIPGFKDGKRVAPKPKTPEATKPDATKPDATKPDTAKPADEAKPGDAPKAVPAEPETAPAGPRLTWGNLYKVVLSHLMKGEFDHVHKQYVFDTRPLTNNRPYFAAYIKAPEIPNFLDQLDAVSDEWGYLLLW
ncbi:MAG: hypothetical protein RLT05_02915, partial [Bauldia litoralis]